MYYSDLLLPPDRTGTIPADSAGLTGHFRPEHSSGCSDPYFRPAAYIPQSRQIRLYSFPVRHSAHRDSVRNFRHTVRNNRPQSVPGHILLRSVPGHILLQSVPADNRPAGYSWPAAQSCPGPCLRPADCIRPVHTPRNYCRAAHSRRSYCRAVHSPPNYCRAVRNRRSYCRAACSRPALRHTHRVRESTSHRSVRHRHLRSASPEPSSSDVHSRISPSDRKRMPSE